MPVSLTSIGTYAFLGCTSLTDEVANYILTKITTIPTSTFSGCTKLSEIVIPTTITSIGQNAFYNAGLTSVIISDGTQSLTINTDAFPGCPLETLYLGRIFSYTTTSASGSPFYNKTSIHTVTLGNNVNTLPNYVFN